MESRQRDQPPSKGRGSKLEDFIGKGRREAKPRASENPDLNPIPGEKLLKRKPPELTIDKKVLDPNLNKINIVRPELSNKPRSEPPKFPKGQVFPPKESKLSF